MKENKFKFACTATELWAREVRHLSNDSVVARALRGSDHDDCLKCLASGCAHVCCRAAWDKLGLKNGFLRLDGGGAAGGRFQRVGILWCRRGF